MVHDCQDGYEIDADGVKQQLFTDHAGSDSAETVEENRDNVKDLTAEGYKSATAEVDKMAESTHDGVMAPVTVDVYTQCLAIVPYVPYVPKVLPTPEADGIVKESTAPPSPQIQSKPPPSASLGAKPKAFPQPKVQASGRKRVGVGGQPKQKRCKEERQGEEWWNADVKEIQSAAAAQEQGEVRGKRAQKERLCTKEIESAAQSKSAVQEGACEDPQGWYCQKDAFCDVAALCCKIIQQNHVHKLWWVKSPLVQTGRSFTFFLVALFLPSFISFI